MLITPKRRTFLLAFTVACILLFVPFSPFAQEGAGPAGPKGPQHAWLAADAGVWNASCLAQTPDGPLEFTGTETNRMGCDGLWLISDFEADFGGLPFSGHGVLGYDLAARELRGIWVDSMSTRVMRLRGSMTETVRTLMTRGSDPMTGEEYDEKHRLRLVSPDERVLDMLRMDGDEEIPLMTIRYTRAQ